MSKIKKGGFDQYGPETMKRNHLTPLGLKGLNNDISLHKYVLLDGWTHGQPDRHAKSIVTP